MRAYEFLQEKDDTLELPNINVGDEVKVGKFKNRKAIVKGFKKDDHNQPVLKTTKGEHKVFKPRITKLEPKKVDEDFGVPTPTPEQVATKHGVSLDKIFYELDLGVKAEQEHTQDVDMATEIALDHLSEMPDYYTRLAKMERGV